MNFIFYLENLLINCISLAFPLAVYLVYIAYSRTINDKENQNALSVAIIISLILVTIFNKSNDYHIYTLLSAPLLLSYISRKEKLSILISFFLILYYNYIFKINIPLQIVEYSTYLLVYKLLNKNKYFYQIFTIIYLVVRLSFVALSILLEEKEFSLISHNLPFFIIVILLLLCFSITIVYLFTRSKRILDIKVVLKQLDKEKEIKASIFKLNHELKNPLAVCSGYLEMIPTAEENKKEQYLSIINDEIKRSLTIINDFSSLGKIKKLEKEELDLALLFEDVQAILNPLYEENNGKITIPIEDEFYIYGDYNRLKQVLVNIIKNSLEAKNKSTINVNIRIKKIKNSYKITITDNGRGMTKNELLHIHEMFYTTKQNGSGIGVPFNKEIINLHKGNISYKSQKNKGTMVTIILPI